MGSNASNMKPDGQKVFRGKPAFDWVALPAEGRTEPAPELPPLRHWKVQTREAWAALWKSPQSTQWDQTGLTMWTWAVLHDDMLEGELATAGIGAEMRQIEDRHGLNPKALLQLRWRIVDETGEGGATGGEGESSATVHRMRIVDPQAG